MVNPLLDQVSNFLVEYMSHGEGAGVTQVNEIQPLLFQRSETKKQSHVVSTQIWTPPLSCTYVCVNCSLEKFTKRYEKKL